MTSPGNKCPPSPKNCAPPRWGQIGGGGRPEKMGPASIVNIIHSFKNEQLVPPSCFFLSSPENKCPPSPENGAPPRGGQIEGGDRPPKMGTRFNCEHYTFLDEKKTIDTPELLFFVLTRKQMSPLPGKRRTPEGGTDRRGGPAPKNGTRFNCEKHGTLVYFLKSN